MKYFTILALTALTIASLKLLRKPSMATTGPQPVETDEIFAHELTT